ncbi:unnamed protein product [Closterium sp. NIES-64]|nr:unnamed protein product [Closterium sp. NIES-64]
MAAHPQAHGSTPTGTWQHTRRHMAAHPQAHGSTPAGTWQHTRRHMAALMPCVQVASHLIAGRVKCRRRAPTAPEEWKRGGSGGGWGWLLHSPAHQQHLPCIGHKESSSWQRRKASRQKARGWRAAAASVVAVKAVSNEWGGGRRGGSPTHLHPGSMAEPRAAAAAAVVAVNSVSYEWNGGSITCKGAPALPEPQPAAAAAAVAVKTVSTEWREAGRREA